MMRLVADTADEHNVHAIVFMGDQHHTHEVVHQEVLDFWRRWLPKLGRESFLIVGNHDRSHNLALNSHTLWPYKGMAKIIDSPFEICIGVLLVPWYPKEEDFRAAVLPTRAKTVICHQTFDGGQYDNGFYAHDGFSLQGLEERRIISGHIHKPQSFANVCYVGAPRWRTRGDVNQTRALHIAEFDNTGDMIGSMAVPTAGHCKQLVEFDMKEGETIYGDPFLNLSRPVDITLNLHGSQTWIDAMRSQYEQRLLEPSTRLAIRSFATRAPRTGVRESEGLAAALKRHVDNYKSQFGTAPEILKQMVTDRVRL